MCNAIALQAGKRHSPGLTVGQLLLVLAASRQAMQARSEVDVGNVARRSCWLNPFEPCRRIKIDACDIAFSCMRFHMHNHIDSEH